MKPDTQHPEYTAAIVRWSKCRDVCDGEDAVHAAGEKYLPKLTEQSGQDYAAYVLRAPFYNATARTIDGLVGMIFRKEPKIDAPAALEQLTEDLTLTDCGFNELAEIIAREVISVARVGLLIEYPVVEDPQITLAQAATQNLRPYATIYKTESVINWKCERINNSLQPVLLVLTETVKEWENEFESKQIDQIRALFLENGYYLQRVYRKNPRGEWEQYCPDIIPLMNNAPLPYIPFVMFGSQKNDLTVQKPPIYDLVTLNLSHYRSTADLEHGAHFTGLPTAVITGYHPDGTEKLAIGSATAWIFPDASADAKYLEFTGQGLGALENRLKDKEAGMAAIGARMLAPEKAAAEAASTVQMRHAGEGAILASISDMIEHGLDRVLQIMAEWAGIKGDIKTEFNDDFIEALLEAPDLVALVAAWQSGAMSYETLFWNMQQGELISDETTIEEEQASIKKNGIPAMALLEKTQESKTKPKA